MELSVQINEEKLVIKLGKVVNSNNYLEVERFCKETINANPGRHILIDMEDCEYISSAGIRVLISINKLCSSLGTSFRIIQVNDSVYEVLDMTRVNSVVTVIRKPRRMSKDGLEVIGVGSTGTVYKLDDDKVLKVFNESRPLERIYQEEEISRKIFLQGIPCAVPYDIVLVDDYYGLVYEMVNAESVESLFKKALEEQNQESIDEVMDIFINYTKEIHKYELPDGYLPDVKKIYCDFVDKYKDIIFRGEDYKYIKNVIDEIPDANNFIHGDLNFANVLLSEKELMLIDVGGAKQGNSIFDINFFPGLYYIGKFNKGIYEKIGMSEDEFEKLIKVARDKYFCDLSGEEKAKVDRQYQVTSIIRVMMLMPDEFLTYDNVKGLIQFIYKEW